MRSSHVVLDQVDGAFDDERLVANAGLSATLAGRQPARTGARRADHHADTLKHDMPRRSHHTAAPVLRYQPKEARTCGHQSAIGGSRLRRPGPRASGADASPRSAGGQRVGTQSVAEAGADWFGENLQAEFRGLRDALGCPAPSGAP